MNGTNDGGVAPSAEGRCNLAGAVTVYAHHSSVHDGVNVEIDAPAGTIDVVVP